MNLIDLKNYTLISIFSLKNRLRYIFQNNPSILVVPIIFLICFLMIEVMLGRMILVYGHLLFSYWGDIFIVIFLITSEIFLLIQYNITHKYFIPLNTITLHFYNTVSVIIGSILTIIIVFAYPFFYNLENYKYSTYIYFILITSILITVSYLYTRIIRRNILSSILGAVIVIFFVFLYLYNYSTFTLNNIFSAAQNMFVGLNIFWTVVITILLLFIIFALILLSTYVSWKQERSTPIFFYTNHYFNFTIIISQYLRFYLVQQYLLSLLTSIMFICVAVYFNFIPKDYESYLASIINFIPTLFIGLIALNSKVFNSLKKYYFFDRPSLIKIDLMYAFLIIPLSSIALSMIINYFFIGDLVSININYFQIYAYSILLYGVGYFLTITEKNSQVIIVVPFILFFLEIFATIYGYLPISTSPYMIVSILFCLFMILVYVFRSWYDEDYL